MDEPDTRHTYEVLSCLGRGAFAEVYHVRMRGPQGFVRDAAMKVASTDAAPGTLARFRDEARMLGLLQDPAVVSAQAPFQLEGRWVMVMDYVDGATVGQVLKQQVFPARAALQFVGEVARVLDKAQRHAGPEGEPLALVHRDLKPGNLMLTLDGHVKLLDFGIARAEFPQREAQTLRTFVGTPGYIAPERLRGVEGPESDVYSLGVLLYVMVTGQPAKEVDVEELEWTDGGVLGDLLAFARDLRSPEPRDRPTAGEVWRRCRSWAPEAEGMDLRSFARLAVAPARKRYVGALVGTVLGGEHTSVAKPPPVPALPTRPEPTPSRRGSRLPLVLAASVLGASLAGLAAVGAVRASRQEGPAVGIEPRATSLSATPPGPSLPKPAPPQHAPPNEPSPQAASADAPEPAPTARLASVTFLSEPTGADVHIDGAPVGRTPLLDYPLSVGDHVLQYDRAGQHITRTIRVGGRHSPTSFTWTSAGLVAE